MAAKSEIIDWDEAMEQCGDDEEFLRELLADLRGETDSQVAKIEETIRVSIEKMIPKSHRIHDCPTYHLTLFIHHYTLSHTHTHIFMN
jgi:hypothetical protein